MAVTVVAIVLVFVLVRLIHLEAEIRRIGNTRQRDTVNAGGD